MLFFIYLIFFNNITHYNSLFDKIIIAIKKKSLLSAAGIFILIINKLVLQVVVILI